MNNQSANTTSRTPVGDDRKNRNSSTPVPEREQTINGLNWLK